MSVRLSRWIPGPLLALAVALGLAPVGSAAQETQEPQQASAPRPIDLQDVLAWKRLGSTTLSDNGAWFAYRLTPQEGDGEVIVRSTADTTEHRFAAGEGGGSVTFSSDSRWLAFTINPTREESQRARTQRRTLNNKMGLVDLTTGEMEEFESVRSFAFAGDRGGWIALNKASAPAAGGGAAAGGGGGGQAGGGGASDRPRGSDLLLHELGTGVELNLGNVADFAFDESGRWLVWVVDAAGKAGNGVQLRDMESGVVRVLENDEARYSRLAWAGRGGAMAGFPGRGDMGDDEAEPAPQARSDQPNALVVLKEVENEDFEDPLYVVLGWTGFEARTGPTKVVYDPTTDESFPEGMTISPNRAPEWSDARDALFFGIHEVEMTQAARDRAEREAAGAEAGEEAQEERPARAASDSIPSDEKPEQVIWHW